MFFTALGLSFIIIFQLCTSIYTLWHKQDLLTKAKQELLQQQAEHTRLQKQLVQVQQPSFIEEQARDKLFLVKPGEQEIFITQSQPTLTSKEIVQKNTLPYWQQWLAAFSL